MSQLEPLMQELQSLDSVAKLPNFFLQIHQQYQYPFCGVILWRSQMKTQSIFAGDESSFNDLSEDNQLQQLCQKRCTPILTSDSKLTKYSTLDNALIIPVRGLGTDTGALIIGMHTDQVGLAQQIAWYWSIVASYIYETVYRLTDTSENHDEFNLTDREKNCLSWAAMGKTSWEIGQILAISERTVNFHLSNCISKTNSNNRQQAISRCISAGYIYI